MWFLGKRESAFMSAFYTSLTLGVKLRDIKVVKTIYTYSGFHELFLNFMNVSTEKDNNLGYEKITIVVDNIPLIP
jgi:hypothetical protein